MGTVLSGGCDCGAIRYEVKAEANFSIICQCRACQRITGAGHSALFAVSADQTTVEGKVNFYERSTDSGGKVRSGFCGDCGNPVMNKPSSCPQFIFLHAATLDDPGTFKPEMVVYETFKQPWDHVDSSLPRK